VAFLVFGQRRALKACFNTGVNTVAILFLSDLAHGKSEGAF